MDGQSSVFSLDSFYFKARFIAHGPLLKSTWLTSFDSGHMALVYFWMVLRLVCNLMALGCSCTLAGGREPPHGERVQLFQLDVLHTWLTHGSICGLRPPSCQAPNHACALP